MARSAEAIQEKLLVLESVLIQMKQRGPSSLEATASESTMNLFLLRGYIAALQWVLGTNDAFDTLVLQKSIFQSHRSNQRN